MARISPSNESLGHNKFFRLQNQLCLLLILLVEREKLMYFCKLVRSVFLFSLSAHLLLELKALQSEKYTLTKGATEQEGYARQTQRLCETLPVPCSCEEMHSPAVK